MKKRLVLAQVKIQQFEAKYHISQLDHSGLPEDANYEMHEDYIIWQHWNDRIEKVIEQISHLEAVAENGLESNEALNVSCRPLITKKNRHISSSQTCRTAEKYITFQRNLS